VRLGRLDRKAGSLPQRLCALLSEELGLSFPADFFETWPRAMSVHGWLLACDGLDKVSDPNVRRTIVRWLEGLADGPHRVLVTPRPAGYEMASLRESTFAHFELEPFDAEQVEAFAHRWFLAALPEHQAEERAAALLKEAQNRELQGLLANPLLVTIMAVVYHERGELPARRLELYQEFIRVLLDEAESRGLKQALAAVLHDEGMAADLVLETPHLLDRVALAAQREDATDERALAAAVAEALAGEMDWPKAKAVAPRWLRVMSQRSGVLVVRGSGYEFLHPTFREYLAACALAEEHANDLNKLWAALSPYVLDEAWAEVIPLSMAHLQDATPLVECLLDGNDNDEGQQRPLFVAAAALADGAPMTADTHRRVLRGLDHLARTRPPWKWDKRASGTDAVRALGRLWGDEEAVAILLAVVRDGRVDVEVGMRTTDAPDKEATPVLFAVAPHKGVDAWVRMLAAKALGSLAWGDDLLALARDEEVDTWGHVAAAVALDTLGRRKEAALIFLALTQDEGVDAAVRSWAVAVVDALARDEEVDAVAGMGVIYPF